MKLSTHPLWLVGFRPFFGLACLSGLSLPIIWVLLFTGAIQPPQTSFSIVQWHAHEMFFGFGWAILGGFLLTSTKNWVRVRGYHGSSLMFLAAAWISERAGMWFEGSWSSLLFRFSNNLFLVSTGAMLLWTLVRHRKNDSFRDNYYFLLIIPAFLVAKNLMLGTDHIQIGWSMALGLFRMAFLVMLERTLTQFMKNVFQATILRNTVLDTAIKGVALILVCESLIPPQLSGWLDLLLALLLSGRFVFWKPQLAMRRLDLGIMYLGYIAIIAQLVIAFSIQVAHPVWIGTVSVHVFTFGVMGLIIPAMVIRISKGHTGRKVVFEAADKLALWIMMLALVFRIIATQIYPTGYIEWLYLAATCWFVCFSILGWRYIPFLLQPRIDGKAY
ncbi:MAG: NnrS family protein [Sterolibacterium sp.]|nr:NnrS family protein [Sterolibacterium sp.]